MKKKKKKNDKNTHTGRSHKWHGSLITGARSVFAWQEEILVHFGKVGRFPLAREQSTVGGGVILSMGGLSRKHHLHGLERKKKRFRCLLVYKYIYTLIIIKKKQTSKTDVLYCQKYCDSAWTFMAITYKGRHSNTFGNIVYVYHFSVVLDETFMDWWG